MKNRHILWFGTVVIAVLTVVIASLCALKRTTRQIMGPDVSDDKQDKIVLYAWKDYIDSSILEDFEKETDIRVILKEYETSDMAISEVQNHPQDYDVIIAYDYTVDVFKQIRAIQKLDLSKIPNSRAIEQSFVRDREYAIPYLYGTTGFVINTDYVPADTDSWSVLWDPKYKGKIVMLDEFREAIAAVLLYAGYSVSSQNPEELKKAEELVTALKENEPEFGETFSNLEQVVSGEKWIGHVYSGDVVYKASGTDNIKFIFPKEGFVLWCDHFTISSQAQNPEGAHKFINFMVCPDIAARSSSTFFYQAPIKGIQQYVQSDLRGNTIMFPSQDVLKRGQFVVYRGRMDNEYQRIFNLLKM